MNPGIATGAPIQSRRRRKNRRPTRDDARRPCVHIDRDYSPFHRPQRFNPQSNKN